MIIENSSLLKHLAIILLYCHKENMFDASRNQNPFIFPPKKIEISQQSLHAMERFGYKYSNGYLVIL